MFDCKNMVPTVQYFDEDSAFPVPFSFLNVFPLTLKALLRWKKPTEVQRTYTITKQAEARKTASKTSSHGAPKQK